MVRALPLQGRGQRFESSPAHIKKVLIIIPAYNEIPQIVNFINKLKRFNYDVLFIDDGSTDGTFDVIRNSGFNYIRNNKNMGKGFSIKRGLEYASKNDYSICITMDADGQHPIEFADEFIKALANYDIVIGSRRKFMNLKQMPIDRYLVNRWTSTFVSIICSKLIFDLQNGYRAMKCEVIRSLRIKSNRFDFETEFIVKSLISGFKVGFLDIPVIYGEEKSHINKLLDTIRALRLYFEIIFSI